MRRSCSWLVTATCVFCISSSGFSNGFKILEVQGARAAAQADAFVAQADDPSSIAYNPAGLTQLEGTNITMGVSIVTGDTERTSASGVKEEFEKIWHYVPNFFISSDINTENIRVGLGVTAPFGMSSEWSDTGFARYVCTYSELQLINVNPTFAYKVNSELSLGCGVDNYISSAKLKSKADYGLLFGFPGTMDGTNELTGDGSGWGYNLGALYRPYEKHSFGLAYRSPVKVKYEGELNMTGIPALLVPATSLKSDAETSINFPASLVAGYAFRPVQKIKIEYNLDWTLWNTLEELKIDAKNPVAPFLGDSVSKYDYQNTLAHKLGIEYSLKKNIKLRGGYTLNQNATPEKTFRPSLADADQHHIGLGAGFEFKKFTVDIAGFAGISKKRTVNNNVDNNELISSSSIDGEYETTSTGFFTNIGYKF